MLVREVHHRIKNNLHTVTALLSSFAESHPEVEEVLNQAATQVQSIAIVHGLQGKFSLVRVNLYDMVNSLATEIQTLWKNTVTISMQEGWWSCNVFKSEAVPLALIMNELVTNAVKHGRYDRHVRIDLSGDRAAGSVKIVISNMGILPDGFNLDTAQHLGTGLQLVASLLPRTAAQLYLSQLNETVVTTLLLESPLIQADEGA